jgi:hypothetical protein
VPGEWCSTGWGTVRLRPVAQRRARRRARPGSAVPRSISTNLSAVSREKPLMTSCSTSAELLRSFMAGSVSSIFPRFATSPFTVLPANGEHLTTASRTHKEGDVAWPNPLWLATPYQGIRSGLERSYCRRDLAATLIARVPNGLERSRTLMVSSGEYPRLPKQQVSGSSSESLR